MITRLYRLAVLGLLLHCASTLREVLDLLATLKTNEQLRNPLRNVPPAEGSREWWVEHYGKQGAAPLASKHGGPHGPQLPSSTASRSETTPTTTTTERSAATGKWTPTSGARMAVDDLLFDPKPHLDAIRTLSPTEASSPEAGSPGPAHGSSGSTPECRCRDSNREGPLRPPGKDKYDHRGLHYPYCPLYGYAPEHDDACEDTDIGMGLSTGCGCGARRRMEALGAEPIADKVFPRGALADEVALGLHEGPSL